jgi:tetratricopeptide (TPR) repeat protein
MELGQEAYTQGRYKEAAQLFIDAFAASPFAAFLYNTAMAYEKAKDNDNAVLFYRRYLSAEPKAPDYAKIDVKIRALLAVSKTQIKPSEKPPGKKGFDITEMEMKSLVSIRTNPSDAAVRILDQQGNVVAQAQGPSGQTIVRGVYTVEASHPDYRTVYTTINVLSGQMYIVVVEMSQGSFLGFLKLTTDVSGAAVYIDNKDDGQVGTTPWENVLPAGKHKILVEKPGYALEEKEVEISLGKEHLVEVTLKRLPFGALILKTNVAGARVFIDEKFLGVAPLNEHLPAGPHNVRVESEGMKDYKVRFTIEGGKTTKILVRMNPSPSRTSAWVSSGVSAAIFIGGGVAGGIALGIKNDLDNARNEGRLASNDPRIMQGFIWGLSADLAFGVGAIVGGMAIYYFLRDPLPPSEAKLTEPVDFTENPKGVKLGASQDDKPTYDEPKTGLAGHGAHLFAAPFFGQRAGGLGLTLVF